MGVWDGVERYERRCMELETHQVHEEENHKWLVSQFPHFPSWPPPDDNLALGPTWHLCTPPTLPMPHYQCPSFWTWACCFGCEPIVSNVTPLSQTQDHCFKCEPVISNVSPSFRVWAHCFEHEPVILNVSLSFWMSACCFEHQPIISNVSLSFLTSACRFECEPIILNVSPSFQTWAHHFQCNPWMALTVTVNATRPGHRVQAMSTMYSIDKGRFGSYLKLCDFTSLFMTLQVELRLNK